MKKNLLLFAGFSLVGIMAGAQQLKEGYITWPVSASFPDYVTQWAKGQQLTVNGQAWEDEEFFTSRVKPRYHFRNNTTQIYNTFNESNDKKLVWWVPVGDEGYNALPNGRYDSEVFSMWSYVTHYGDWNSPQGWVPGPLADAAHKNGVAVSGVASIPYGSISGEWSASLNKYPSAAADAGKFLYYHGVDGLGYNSEFNSGSSTVAAARTMNEAVHKYLTSKGVQIAENVWYDGTNDSGSINFDAGLSSHNQENFGDGEHIRTSLFFNYNSNRATLLENSVSKANSMGRSPLDLYIGHNMQGGEPRSGSLWTLYKDYPVSIGLWGAHSTNMFWSGRNGNGSAPETMQRTYLNTCEQWFSNGARNPAVRLPLVDKRNHRPDDTYHGMSAMMTARSSMSWDLAEEPFITHFNLGNGRYFNYEGVRMNNNEWYNLGVQDYLPTWRFWFADKFMNTDVQRDAVKLNAEFTWDDAYFGGSCLRIKGTSDDEFLHLFKTQYQLKPADVIVIKYKLLNGDVTVDFAPYCEGKTVEYPLTEESRSLRIVGEGGTARTYLTAEQAREKSESEWVERKITLGNTVKDKNNIPFNQQVLAQLGLRFRGAKDMDLLIGEIAIYRGNANMPTPAMPKLKSVRVLSNNYKGVDAKMFWEMENSMPAGEPVYNSDVNTSMFRMWSCQEGGEPVMVGVTNQWAGIIFSAPSDPNLSSRMKFGVEAVALDMKTTSGIQWSEDFYDMGDYDTSDEISLDKQVLKPGQKFTLSYVDPRHESGEWTIVDSEGKTMYSGSGHSVTVEDGMPSIGAYDLKLTCNGKETVYERYIPVSSEAVGAIPEIHSLTIDEADAASDSPVEIELNTTHKFGYTGRNANGSASRGIDLNENWFGVSNRELGISANHSFSVAAWVKYNELPEGRSNFITIENRAGGWPYNNWGYFWSRITEEGKFVHPTIDTAWGMRTGQGTEGMRLFNRFDDARINVGAWTHVAVIFEYEEGTSNLRQKFYINGKQQMANVVININKGVLEGLVGGDWTQLEKGKARATAYSENTYEPDFAASSYPLTLEDWISFGGMAHEITAVKGCVDDFQIWDKAMTAEEVKQSMEGLDGNNLPEGVLAYWDMEDDPAADYSFAAKGKKAGAKAYWYAMEKKSGEGEASPTPQSAPFLTGCPYIAGTAYPIETIPTWTAAKASINGAGTDTQGSADITFSREGDHVVTLKLENGHGAATMEYPVLSVRAPEAIDGILSEGDFRTYTVGDGLFVEFAQAGNYKVEVYNVSGMLVGAKDLAAEAMQTATVRLGNPGVYMVRVSRDGQVLRTVKVIRK